MATSTSTSNKQKRAVKLNGTDVCAVLQRYAPDTILVLLQELVNFAGQKLNWTEITNAVNSRVPNPRDIGPKQLSETEIRRLWRYLAYRQPLVNCNGDGDGDSEDGESDLEFEIEQGGDCLNFDVEMKEVVNCVHKLVSATSVELNLKKTKDKFVKK
ncbi:hypothetical protein vseg_006596 [Gypsophila vaccaria]